ncbi:putative ankyrin repeat protein L63 [Zancudomyces culisetae]|uniref:Putative ankyrin repeat protein L63 n=1 Tax=Zancudomyces culisetae TaxID=1213189 RepID=A0A1R1PRF1_ZANCU|nr:putative ankyrin repeat protein L63 [Zancudomyces culisetae]|eukprot:OMH83537.1 putative ankyrin repeat protein L63 [Zancudomyces culisetae]
MYMLIEKNTSQVIFTNSAFLHEGEKLDLDTQNLTTGVDNSGFVSFVRDYGYGNHMDRVVQMACIYYSMVKKRDAFLDFFETSEPEKVNKQLVFDTSIGLEKVDLAKRMFFEVDPNQANIRKMTNLAFETKSIDLITFMLKNQEYLKGDLDQNALRTAIESDSFQVAKEIIGKYHDTIGAYTPIEAIETGKVELVKLLIDVGMDISGAYSEGIRIACARRDKEMLQLLVENGATLCNKDKSNCIPLLCRVDGSEIANHLLLGSGDLKKASCGGEHLAKNGNQIRFLKILRFLLEYGLAADGYFYEKFMRYLRILDLRAVRNLVYGRHQNFCSGHFDGYDPLCTSSDKICEIAKYIIENNIQLDETISTNLNDHVLSKNKTTDMVLLSDWDFDFVKSTLINRNFEMIKILTENGVDINLYNYLVLKTAYLMGDIKWIDYFTSKGAKLGTRENSGLKEACESDNVNVLQHWLSQYKESTLNFENPALNLACERNNFAMVQLLVNQGVDLGDSRLNGIEQASKLNDREILEYLLRKNAPIGNFQHCELERACMSGDISVVRLILEHNNRLSLAEKSGSNTVIREAGLIRFDENPWCVTTYHTQGLDVSHNYSLAEAIIKNGYILDNNDLIDGLWAAVTTGRSEIARLLLDYGTNIREDVSLLTVAVEMSNIEMVSLLLEYGASMGENSGMLGLALEMDNVNIFRLLLKNGLKITNNSYGISYDVNINSIATTQLLLEYHPDLGKDPTLFYRAVGANNIEVVKLLLNCGNGIAHGGYNLIAEACKNNSIQMLLLLLENSAKIKRGDKSGITQACKHNNLEMVQLLLQKNPNLVLDKCYGIPEAIKNGNMRMVKLLVKHGARINSHAGVLLALAFLKSDLEFIQYSLTFSPKLSKNFVRKLRRMAARNGKDGRRPIHKKHSISRMILEHLGLM